MAENITAQVSENPLDYLSMIVYVKKGVDACDQLRAHTASRLDVMLQDVDLIQGARPPWLRGVPTVVKLPGREVLTGTRAIAEVMSLCRDELQGANAFSHGPGAPLQAGAQTAQPFAELFSCAEDILAPGDPRYCDAPKEKQNETSLEDIMRRRGGI